MLLAITSGKRNHEKIVLEREAGRVLEGYIHLLAESGNIDVNNIPAVSRIILEGDEIKRKVPEAIQHGCSII